MAVKPNGRLLVIREQIIEDAASGLTLQFEVRDNGHSVLKVFGPMCREHREIVFEHSGGVGTTDTVADQTLRPSWLSIAKQAGRAS